MPRKCHLCASTAHSAATCHRLLQVFGLTNSASSSGDQKFSPSQNIKKQNGLQFILPYHHIFSVPVKGRWEGKTLAEAFRAEFCHYPIEYFEPACRDGRLKLVWDLFHLRKAEKAVQQQQQQSGKNTQKKNNSNSNNNIVNQSNDNNMNIPVEERRRQREGDDQFVEKNANFDPPSHPDTVLKVGMIILHRVHRHELPVLENVCPIEIVDFVHVPTTKTTTPPNSPRNNNSSNTASYVNKRSRSPPQRQESEVSLRGIIAINKPPSIPVHSCGRYHYNTVQHMLRCGFFEFDKHKQEKIADKILSAVNKKIIVSEEENNTDNADQNTSSSSSSLLERKIELAKKILQDQVFGDSEDAETSGLHSCHRLDRGTSGVLLFATCGEVAKLVFNALADKSEEPDDHSNHQASSISRSTNKMSKIYLARVHGKVIPPADAIFEQDEETKTINSSSSSRFFYLQRSIFCANAKDGNFACLTAEQEQKAVKFRQEQIAQEKYLAQQDAARKMELFNQQQQQQHQQSQDSIEALKKEKRERQAQICKGRNARGAFSNTEQNNDGNDNDENNNEGGEEEKSNDKDEKELKAIQFSKWAATWFRVLSYDEKLNESIVECHPVTGRTHQLRVHLAMALNCPILGDDVYGNQIIFSSSNNETFDFEQDLRELLSSMNNQKDHDDDDGDDNKNTPVSFDPAPLTPGVDFELDPACPECTYNRQKEPHFISGGSPFIALHAWKYKIKLYDEERQGDGGEDQTIMTEIPEWCRF